MSNFVFVFKFLRFVLAAFCLLSALSCAQNSDEFARQRQHLRSNNPINVTQEDPVNYYYQEPNTRNSRYGQQYQSPYYQPVPAYMPGSYQVPASRFYSNPYAIPPSNVNPRYDMDQYYVPPTNYRNIERQRPSSINYGDGADGKS